MGKGTTPYLPLVSGTKRKHNANATRLSTAYQMLLAKHIMDRIRLETHKKR